MDLNSMARRFYRFTRNSRSAFLMVCFISTAAVFLIYFESRERPDPWASKSIEAGLLKVMMYIEKEREIDSVVRDAFVDRVWKNVKLELMEEVYNMTKISIYQNNNGVTENDLKKNIRDNLKHIETKSSSQIKTLQNYQGIYNISDDNLMKVSRFLSNPKINTFHTSYIYDNSAYCSISEVDYLIVLPSAPDNFKRREDVRKSDIAQFVKIKKHKVKMLFFLGSPNPEQNPDWKKIQSDIDTEQLQYGDIVQATYIDTYKNITKKAAMLFDWSANFCSGAKFLIRTDDDIVVNISKIIEAMHEKSKHFNNFILGQMRIDAPKRKKSSKYYIPYEEAPYKMLPPFLLGGAYGLPISTAPLLLEAMRRIPVFWLDDVYVTGMCAGRVGVPIFNSTAFQFKHE